MPAVHLFFGKRKQKQFRKVTAGRTESTVQVSQLRLNGTCALAPLYIKYGKSSKYSCRETGHVPQNFPDRIISASMFNDITRWESQKVQATCVVWAREKVVVQQDSDLVIGVSVIQDRKRPGKTVKSDHFHKFADGGWDNLALRMINELLISKHPLFKCWNILQTGVFIGRTKGGGAGTHFKNEPENHLMLVQMTLACDHLCLFFFHKNSTDWNLHPRLQSGRSHGVSPPRATSLCSRWCGHVLTELTKEQEKEPLQPTQQELMVKASQEAGFSKTIDICQFFRTRPLCNTDGKWVCTALQRIYQTEIYRRIEVVWSSSWESRIGPVLDALVSDD